MSDFEYFFTFFGLLLGLTVAEVAVRLADAIAANPAHAARLRSEAEKLGVR